MNNGKKLPHFHFPGNVEDVPMPDEDMNENQQEAMMAIGVALIKIEKLGETRAGPHADERRRGYIDGLHECAKIATGALERFVGVGDDD